MYTFLFGLYALMSHGVFPTYSLIDCIVISNMIHCNNFCVFSFSCLLLSFNLEKCIWFMYQYINGVLFCICYNRDFAYVARDNLTQVLKCHVFRCDSPAKNIATSLHEMCSRVILLCLLCHIHYWSKVLEQLLIQGFFYIFTVFYIVE